MDTVRFEELKHTIEFGGLPKIDNESFTKEQKAELEEILKNRSKNSLDYIKTIKIS